MGRAKLIQRTAIAAAGLCTVAALAGTAWIVAAQPSAARWETLQSELEIDDPAESGNVEFGRKTDYRAAYDLLQTRGGIWKPLIVPKRAPVQRAEPPSRTQKLGGIRISMEMTTVEGDTLVRITDSTHNTEEWRGVGDVIRADLEIVEIRPDRVVFEFMFGGAAIRYGWPRD